MNPLERVYSDGIPALIGICTLTILLASVIVAKALKGDPVLRQVIGLGIALRIVVFAFYVVWLLPFYAEEGFDAISYHEHGVMVANMLRAGYFEQIVIGTGTRMVDLLTALLYLPFGANLYAAYFFSAALSLAGAIAFHKAYRIWSARENVLVHSILLFVLPSFALWTSLFGKDSWVCLGLGLSSCGYSYWLTGANKRRAALTLAAGLLIVILVRPHIAFMLGCAIGTTSIWLAGKRTGLVHRLVTTVLFLPLILGSLVLVKNATGMKKQGIQALFDLEGRNQKGNQYGGSKIDVQEVHSPSEMIKAVPAGIVKIYLRPFPWEAKNANAMLAALENLVLVAFWFRLLFSLKNTLMFIRTKPYFGFCALMMVELTLFLTPITNLGLLSRQRAMLIPYLIALAIGPRVSMRHSRVRTSNTANINAQTPAMIGAAR